ncbi:AdeC/AdeK/OprM family multidrug efflux complex outer membrane factor [Achromobacter aloeverae]|uniref:Multidrug transporter n=1 Tax=Achromobacter aloeverae TaxID=1750518 RepID=A0A4Q1HPA3_9BURK|nr:AdeC/AdeK/OprM family multidrug efflux complex outer membrane factor [Achromobacter aloeverae]RXN91695.1 multidrug transporter [Achromobacter aloeverae]
MSSSRSFRPGRLAVAVALASALAGCTLIPDYQRPAAPVDAAYPTGPAYDTPAGAAAKPASQAGVATANIGWRDMFPDPLLQQLIELSLSNNRDLRIAALNVQSAQAQYRIQRADLLPTVGVGATESAQRTPHDLTSSGKAVTSHTYQVGASLSWELDLFGRIRSLSEEALQTYLAQDETRNATQLTLVSEVANAYLTLRADQELLKLTQDTLKSQRDSYDLTKQSYDNDVATALDLSQAEVSVRTAESNLAQYSRQVAQDMNALVLLLGNPLPDDVRAKLDTPGRLDDALIPTALPAGLPSDLLERRPDIRSAEHSLLAANADIGAARAAFFPTISLTGSAGTASATLGGLFKGGSGAWSFAPQITTPIFAGGSLRAELDVAKLQKQIQVATYEQAIQSAFREVADALAGRGTLDQQIQAQQLLVQADQRAYDLSQQRYRQGIDNYLTVLDSQRSLYSAQQTLVTTRLTRLTNLVTLYKALGGGWTDKTVQAQASAPEPRAAQ